MNNQVEFIKLNVTIHNNHPVIHYMAEPEFEGIVEVKHIVHKGIERRVALDKDAQELIDMFVSLETNLIKDIMINERKLHDIEIDKIHHELRLAKNSWWNKFKSWLS